MYWMKCNSCKRKTPHYRKQYEVLKHDRSYEYSRYEDYWVCEKCGAPNFTAPCRSHGEKAHL